MAYKRAIMIFQPVFTKHLQVRGVKLGFEYPDAKSLLEGQEYSQGTQAPSKAVPHPERPGKEVRTSATFSGKLALSACRVLA